MPSVTQREALKVLIFQYYFGILFAFLGVAFSIFMYFSFRDSGVPVAGSSERASPLLLALVAAAISILFGAGISLVVRPAIRRLKAEAEDRAAGA